MGRHVLYGVAGEIEIALLFEAGNLAEKSLRLNPVAGGLQALTGLRFQFAALASLLANLVGGASFRAINGWHWLAWPPSFPA